MAEAAMSHVDRLIFVMLRTLPHKDYSDAAFEERLALMKEAAGERSEVMVTEGGLLTEIARELRKMGEITFLRGRDAAEFPRRPGRGCSNCTTV